jgi:hypothetical protein
MIHIGGKIISRMVAETEIVPNPDILILSVPLTTTQRPMHAGAVLKSVANKAGYSCATMDLNKITLNWIETHPNRKLTNYFVFGETEGLDFKFVDEFLSIALKIVAEYHPKILGLSVFTDHSRIATKLIAQGVRQHFPEIKIIIGGSGCVNPDAANAANHPVPVNREPSFAETLRQQNLIDFYIQGDAEHAFYEFLKNNRDFVGINQDTWRQLDNNNLLDLPYPDYSDYDWSLYEDRILGITGSRGCVRQCRFCDYIVAWKNFTWRGGQHIFDEMLYQKDRYNISFFHFTDSLINGNMAEYRTLITLLAEYNKNNPIRPFRWSSFLIVKSPAQFDDELWKLTADSGCELLMIGLETLVERVRFDMNKKFTNQDIEFCIEKIVKYNIPVSFLLFVGYPTETDDDIKESIKWLEEHQHLKDHISFYFNETMFVLQGSWLEQNKEIHQIKLLDPSNALKWVTPTSTLEIREARSKLFRNTAKLLGYSVLSQDDDQFHQLPIDPHTVMDTYLSTRKGF